MLYKIIPTHTSKERREPIMKNERLPLRTILFILGTAFNAFGITLITKAYLGTSPISSLPFVLSLGLPPSFGTLTFIFNMIFFVGQIIILKKNFAKIQFLQIPVTIVFSLLIDLFMSFFVYFKPSNYLYSVLLLILGCGVMAFGITLTITADLIMTPGNAFVNALAGQLHKNYGTVEIYFDTTLTVLAVIASFILFGKFRGVREGTVISAFLIGSFINLYHKLLGSLLDKVKVTAKDTPAENTGQCI